MGSVKAMTRRQLVLIMMGTVGLRNGQFSPSGQRSESGVSVVANGCSQREAQSPAVVKRRVQRVGWSTALPNNAVQPTHGAPFVRT